MHNYYQRQPYYYHKRHHYFRNTIIIILLLAIGAGSAYIISPNSSTHTQQSSQQASSNNSNDSNNSHGRDPISTIKDKANTIKNRITRKKSTQPINKPGYTLAVFPKNIQGTWYSYDKYSNGQGKRIDRITITPTTISETKQPNTYLHARPKKAQPPTKLSGQAKTWSVALPCNVRGISLTDVRGWGQTAGDGAYFGVINTHDMDVLDLASGADAWTTANYFRSPSQAKQYANKMFHGEKSNNP